MVSPGEWGPSAWKLLHGLAERVGNQTLDVMIRDEKNELRIVLKDLWYLMPCRHCQEHYREWLRFNPPDSFLSKGAGYLQEDLRDWVFRLHESVNSRREVVSGFLPDTLTETYSTVNLREQAVIFKTVYQRGLQTGVLKPEEWKKTWRHLDLLLRSLGC
jgi:hypothetical protein